MELETSNMKILFFGRKTGNTKDREMALKKLGHKVYPIYLREEIEGKGILGKYILRTGGFGCNVYIWSLISKNIKNTKFDLVFINQENYLPKSVVVKISEKYGNIIQYINDDPFNGRRKYFWHSLLKSLPIYKLVVLVREVNVNEALSLGAQNVCKVYMSADENRHAKRQLEIDELKKYSSDVVFIGTCFEERGKFIEKLVKSDINVHIYGNGWDRCKQWEKIKQCHKGNFISGDEYSKTISGSRIALCLLSKYNRDEYTTRSMEIPSIGTFLMAERTKEHMNLYREGIEAEFFETTEECISKIKYYLTKNKERNRIAENGHKRFLRENYTVVNQINKIINEYKKIVS